MELSETTEVSDSSVDSLVTSMLQRSGQGQTDRMTFEQFREVFCDDEFRHTLEAARLTGEGQSFSQDLSSYGGLNPWKRIKSTDLWIHRFI